MNIWELARVVNSAMCLAEMGGPQQMGDIPERLPGQQRQPFGIDLEHIPAVPGRDGNMVFGEQSVFGGILTEREHGLVMKFSHDKIPPDAIIIDTYLS